MSVKLHLGFGGWLPAPKFLFMALVTTPLLFSLLLRPVCPSGHVEPPGLCEGHVRIMRGFLRKTRALVYGIYRQLLWPAAF